MDETKAQITKIAREVSKLVTRTLKLDGIGPSEFDLIHVIRKHDGITAREISAILGTDKGALSRQIANLSRKGYIRIEPHPQDGRSRLLFKTPKADALKVSKRKVESTFYEWLLEGLDEKEKELFLPLLDKLYRRSKQESLSGFVEVRKRIEDRHDEEN